jgi:hypothetical protein
MGLMMVAHSGGNFGPMIFKQVLENLGLYLYLVLDYAIEVPEDPLGVT